MIPQEELIRQELFPHISKIHGIFEEWKNKLIVVSPQGMLKANEGWGNICQYVVLVLGHGHSSSHDLRLIH